MLFNAILGYCRKYKRGEISFFRIGDQVVPWPPAIAILFKVSTINVLSFHSVSNKKQAVEYHKYSTKKEYHK